MDVIHSKHYLYMSISATVLGTLVNCWKVLLAYYRGRSHASCSV